MKEADSAYKSALRLLGFRRYTSMELEKKLAERGFNKDLIKEALIRLTETGYIEDEAILHDYATYLAKEKKLGKFKIREKLKSKGFSQGEIEKILKIIEEVVSPENSISYWIEKKLKTKKVNKLSNKEIRKFMRFLANKGFEPSGMLNRLKIDGGDDL